MTINEAIEAIRKVVPWEKGILGRNVSIEISVTDYSGVHYDGTPVGRKVEIQVWDGKKHYEGNTLAEAVAACVTANQDEPQGTMEEAECLLAEVQQ